MTLVVDVWVLLLLGGPPRKARRRGGEGVRPFRGDGPAGERKPFTTGFRCQRFSIQFNQSSSQKFDLSNAADANVEEIANSAAASPLSQRLLEGGMVTQFSHYSTTRDPSRRGDESAPVGVSVAGVWQPRTETNSTYVCVRDHVPLPALLCVQTTQLLVRLLRLPAPEETGIH